jgi:antitoxin (DNA-binding transcriptional repressor) of toxin-antitoxin stability system
MLQINVHDPKIKLSDLIEAAEKGEEILIVTDNKKTYKIIEVEKPKRRRKAGSAKGMIEIADDFDAPLEEFKEYT